MKSLTITLDEDMSAFVCADAAKRGMSVSDYMDRLVKECMEEALSYNEAREAFFALSHFPAFDLAEGRRPSREELHERARLR